MFQVLVNTLHSLKMGSKLKPGGVRRHLKEKVVQMYEDLFHGTDPCANNPRFWDDLFLLKVKIADISWYFVYYGIFLHFKCTEPTGLQQYGFNSSFRDFQMVK